MNTQKNNMRKIIYLLLGVLFIVSCSSPDKFEITGKIENAEGKKIEFAELLVNGTKPIEKVEVDKDGRFIIKSETDIPRFYYLALSKNNFLTLLIEPGENITINVDSSNLSYGKIIGSPGSVLVQKINNQLSSTLNKLEIVNKEILDLQEKNLLETKYDELNSQYAQIVDEQRDSSIAFIISNLNSLASIVALYQKYDGENYVLYKNRDLQYIKIVSESLAKKYPESNHVKALIADKDNLLKRYNQIKESKKLEELVSESTVFDIPEIYLPNQSGDSISLNGVNAEYILLNFWASWSEESVKRNVGLLDLYKKYHVKGFEIYQVSLDTKTENWTRAINFDQLPWINVIDTNGRMSYFAKIYNVRTLPTSFLINPEGEIVTVNPSREQLESTLQYNLK